MKSRLPHGGDSGDFWMSKDDWVKQFESMTICLMPDFFANYNQKEVSRVLQTMIGKFG